MPRKISTTQDISDNLLTLQEASSLLHCHPNTLRKWDRKGLLQAIHVGKRGDRRYRKADLVALMNTQKSTPSLHTTTQTVLEQMHEAFISWDRNWNYLYVNEKAAEYLHRKKEDLIGKSMIELYPNIQETELFRYLQETLRTGKPQNYVYLSVTSHSWIDCNFYPTEQGISMYFEDIEESKRNRQMNKFLLQATNVLSSSLGYKETLHNLGKVVIPSLADWFILEIFTEKHEIEDVFILHNDPLKIPLAKKLHRIILQHPEARQITRQTLTTGQPTFYPKLSSEDMKKGAVNKEHFALMQDLQIHSIISVPLFVEGRIIGVSTFILSETKKSYDTLDMEIATEVGRIAGIALSHARLYKTLEKELNHSKQVEHSLRASEKKLEAFLSHSHDAFLVIDQYGNMIYRSPFAQRLSGYGNDEIEDVGMFLHLYEEDRERIKNELRELAKKPKKTITTEYRIQHKNGKIVWFEATATNWLQEPSVQGIVINFRDITERKNYEKQLKIQASMLHYANDAVFVFTPKNEILYWNQQATRLYGWTAKEAVGHTAHKLLKTDFSPLSFKENFQTLSEKGVWKGELKQTTKSGRKIIVDSRWAKVCVDDEVYIVEINRDVTDKNEMEERKDEFISIASHELKTPLTSLKIFTQFLQKRVEHTADPKVGEYLEKIVHQTNNLSGLVSDLLDISKIQAGKLQFTESMFDIDKEIHEVVDVMNTFHGKRIRISGTLPQVYADAGRLMQVVDNFLSNAIKYSPRDSAIDVLLSSNKTSVKVCVKDRGIGIEEKYHRKVFERFFRAGDTAEHTYPGLGIGLHICSEIIKRYHGKIWVESEKGKGATFCFSIPLQREIA